MLAWLSAHFWTIVILFALILVVGAAARSVIRGRRLGKSSCGCGCAHCAMSGKCGAKK